MQSGSSQPVTTSCRDRFAVHAREVSLAVRAALAAALEACGADPMKPQGLARVLGLDKSLAWKVARVVTDADPLAAVCRLPGRSGVKIALASLARAGASVEQVEAVQASLAALEEMIETHAGDRETLEIMLTSVMPSGGEREEQFRKMAYQGNSAVFGVRARAQLALHVVAPNKIDKGRLDLAVVTGLFDLVRLRPDTSWAVATVRVFDGAGNEETPRITGAIDPSGLTPEGLPLMREFCSEPLPPVQMTKQRSGSVRFEIAAAAVGQTAALDCVTGWFQRSCVAIERTEKEQHGSHAVQVGTPSESAVFDLFVHRTLAFAHQPEVAVYSMMPGGPELSNAAPEVGRLPLSLELERLDMNDLQAEESANYAGIVGAAVTRLGWPMSEFVGVRARVKYPPVPSLIVMRYGLPEEGR